MTERQREVYEAIITYIDDNKISPTIRELCEILNVRSTSTMYGLVNRLAEKGLIKKKKDSPRSISVV